MVALRRTLHLTVGLVAALCLTAFAPPPQGTRVTDNAILAEQVVPASAAAFLEAHRGLSAETLDKNPAVVASWWQSLSDPMHESIVRRMPGIVGNLAGVDFATRDAANRAQLDSALAELLEVSARHTLGAAAEEQLAALRAIQGALNSSSIPRYLIEFTSDQPPLAAISIGDLDTARLVTFAVPGMGTLATDMQLWTRAAKNIYDAQSAAGAQDQAVIAWVGYRTPPVGVEATRDAYADRGALLLRRDILGLRAARGEGPQPVVNIVAHSYGSTTAAKAITPELAVRSFVILGSAGIDTSHPTASDLAAEYVFSGESSSDLQARWGRLERVDPSSAAFGATILDVEGTGDLLPVTGHEPIIHSPWNDDPQSPLWLNYADTDVRTALYADHMASFGYLDVGTESLAEIGTVTTPPSLRGHAYATLHRGTIPRLLGIPLEKL